MDENLEKKPKRPRIGEVNPAFEDNNAEGARYEKVESASQGEEMKESPEYQHQGGYQPRGGYQRGYNQQRGGYQQRGYNQQRGGYQQRGYNQQRGGYQQRGYQQGGYQQGGYQQGGYQRGYQQGGYNQRYQQRDYNNEASNETDNNMVSHNPDEQMQHGYNQQRHGGYQQRGYNQRGGYQQRGYNQRGGYQQRGYQQRGGFQQGGYQQGGYQQRRPKRNAGPRPQMRFTPRPQPVEYEEVAIDPNAQIRLNKYMANAGLCSRREADELITAGKVKVNGEVITELGFKVTPQDTIEYNDQIVTAEKKCYILLNKPKDCVTTSDDPNGRKTVMDLVKGACNERIYPVGRLDRNTTGVLLLTNDGDLASKLTHPKYVKKKIYHVWTDKPISEEDMQRIADGIELDDGPIHADAVSYVSTTDRKQAGIEIHSGRNRVVRRIFESLGYHVVKLDRVYFAGLTKKNLTRGRWRYLTQEEVNFLKQGSFE